MVFTASQRAAIAENDPTWLLKLRIRGALTILLFIPLGCFANVVASSSNFQSLAFQYDTRVWPCILLIVLSWLWNLITILIYTKWKRPLNPLIQLLIHGLLTLLFIIVGAVATHNAVLASSLVDSDPYAQSTGNGTVQVVEAHTIRADNGSFVTVTAENEQSCPAFANCTAQEIWMRNTQHRAGVAIAGCALFFLVMPIHLLLTILFVRDYRIRRAETQRLGSDAFQMNTTPPSAQNLKRPYGTTKPQEESGTSQVDLLRDGRGGLGFHKPAFANDSVLSLATSQATSQVTSQPRPSTSNTAKSRPRFMRPKSIGPSLPLDFLLSRSSSKASTIASRRRKSADIAKDLPPVPPIDTSMLRGSMSDSIPPLTPDTAILTRTLETPIEPGLIPEHWQEPKSLKRDWQEPKSLRNDIALEKETAINKDTPSPPKKASPPKLTVFPPDQPQPPPGLGSPKTPTPMSAIHESVNGSPAITLQTPKERQKMPFDRSTSPTHDPFSPVPFDHDELSALPVIPPEGLPRVSRDASRPTSPLGGFGEMEMLRTLRNTLFASDAETNRSRSSFASGRTSPFGRSHSPISFQSGQSGRQSPWTARKERRELLKEIERERIQREKELQEAEQKAYRAAEKMESSYLRDEIRIADEKAAMRKKRIEDRIQKLKDTLEELKRTQDEEERRAEERAEKERVEEEEFQQEMAKYGKVVAARVTEHLRSQSEVESMEAANSMAASRPTTLGAESRPATRGGESRPTTRGGESRPTTRGVESRPGTSAGRGKSMESSDSKRTEKELPPIPPIASEIERPERTTRYSWETGRTVAHTRKHAPG